MEYNEIYKNLYLPAYGNLFDGTRAITDEVQQDYFRATKYKNLSESRDYNASVQAEFCAIAKYILVEATLKCYKLLFVSIQEDLLNYSNPLTIYLCTKDGNEYNKKFKNFIRFAEQSDQIELTGRPIQAIDKIKESVRIGYELQNSIDTSLARYTKYLNAKLIAKFLTTLFLIWIAYFIWLYLINYANPLITYMSTLEGNNAFFVSVIASIVVLILIEACKLIRRAF
jgi:hypothetical protein